jgi:DNA polymerase III delta subunit
LLYQIESLGDKTVSISPSQENKVINKIITSNLSRYHKGYSYGELVQVIQELRKLDVLSKSTSINETSLIQPLIVKICNNQYV